MKKKKSLFCFKFLLDSSSTKGAQLSQWCLIHWGYIIYPLKSFILIWHKLMLWYDVQNLKWNKTRKTQDPKLLLQNINNWVDKLPAWGLAYLCSTISYLSSSWRPQPSALQSSQCHVSLTPSPHCHPSHLLDHFPWFFRSQLKYLSLWKPFPKPRVHGSAPRSSLSYLVFVLPGHHT